MLFIRRRQKQRHVRNIDSSQGCPLEQPAGNEAAQAGGKGRSERTNGKGHERCRIDPAPAIYVGKLA